MSSGNKKTASPALGMAGLAILSLLYGCLGTEDTVNATIERGASDSAAPEGPQPLQVSAITTRTFEEAKGKIQIRVKTCDTTPVNFTNCAYCSVDEGWARIGGGGQILGESSPGAMIQASYPDPNYWTAADSRGCYGPAGHNPPRLGIDNKATWVARASGANHRLQAYVIGIRMLGTDGKWFKPYVTEGRDRVTNTVNPPALAMVETREQESRDAGTVLIGGGAYVFRGDNNLNQATATDAYLVGSYPIGEAAGRAWRAVVRSQQNPAPLEGIKSFGIFIESCPAQMAPTCLTYPMIRSMTAAATSEYGTASLTIPEFQVVTSVGGYASTSSGGPRYLADLIPFDGSNQGLTVRSKAYATGTGPTTGYALTVGLTHSVSTLVAAHSNKCIGVLNARTDATAPVVQQTRTPSNPPSHTRIAMVLRPGGYWALKFEHTGMCLDISGGSQDNGAAATQYPCTYSDNQLFQRINYNADLHVFKFKHSGKCLDVTGASTAEGAGFIQYTCKYQANQSFRFVN